MITKKDFLDFKEVNKMGYKLFNLEIVGEIYSLDDHMNFNEDELVDISNIVKDCYLKDEAGYNLCEIVEAVLVNYNEIKSGEYSPRKILIKYL